MTPKIIFKYSKVYDEKYKEELPKELKKKLGYPSSKKILDFIKKIEKIWRKDEKRILEELSKITKLKWKSDFIYCYVVGRARAFSDPLTLPVFEKHPDWFIDVLVHELIHQLLGVQRGNKKRVKKAESYFNKKYKRELLMTRIHIPLHAIHSHIYFKFFNEKRLDRDIKIMNKWKDYKKSWDIVQREGYQNIIKEFTKRIR